MIRLVAALGTAGLVALASAMPAVSAPANLSPVAGVSQSTITTVGEKGATKDLKKPKKAAKKAPAKKASKKG